MKETHDENDYLEMFRRATLQADLECLQRHFSGIMLCWLARHPSREAACRLNSEEHYVALAFERFWQATVHYQELEFPTLAAALHALQASLNAAILDTIRRDARAKELRLSDCDDQGEPQGKDQDDHGQWWERIQAPLPNEHDKRLAYLLFHCGLKPREIVHYYSQEFSDMRAIHCLRRTIMERLQPHSDRIPGR